MRDDEIDRAAIFLARRKIRRNERLRPYQEDLEQEIRLSLLESREKGLDSDESMRIAGRRTELLAWRYRRQGIREKPVGFVGQYGQKDSATARELLQLARKYVSEFDPDVRATVGLLAGGYSQKEIASILGVSETTITRHKQHAMAELKKRLERDGYDF